MPIVCLVTKNFFEFEKSLRIITTTKKRLEPKVIANNVFMVDKRNTKEIYDAKFVWKVGVKHRLTTIKTVDIGIGLCLDSIVRYRISFVGKHGFESTNIRTTRVF